MFLRAILLASCLLAPQLSFADPKPVPAEKSAYVGDWQAKTMRLHIFQNGKVVYKREQPGKNISLDIELVRFNGDNFDAGVDMGFAKASSTFVVNKPPHREGDKWKMTVDGVELTKVE
jgi:hypothetical protein